MLLIGISGGSGCGKSTVVRKIVNSLPAKAVSIISQDSYYKDSGHLSAEEKTKKNFDHPSSIEFSLLYEHLCALKNGQKIHMPTYSYVSCARLEKTIVVYPRSIIIVEGILILTNPKIRNLVDIKVYVDADADDRLIRIIQRDIKERGRSFTDVLCHYEKFVKPMHQQFIEPVKKHADIVIPQGGLNAIGIDILTSKIKQYFYNSQDKTNG